MLQALILLFLLLDVGSDDSFIATGRRDKVALGPEVLPDEIAPSLAMNPREMDGALALDLTNGLGHGIFWGNGDHYVHLIDNQKRPPSAH